MTDRKFGIAIVGALGLGFVLLMGRKARPVAFTIDGEEIRDTVILFPASIHIASIIIDNPTGDVITGGVEVRVQPDIPELRWSGGINRLPAHSKGEIGVEAPIHIPLQTPPGTYRVYVEWSYFRPLISLDEKYWKGILPGKIVIEDILD